MPEGGGHSKWIGVLLLILFRQIALRSNVPPQERPNESDMHKLHNWTHHKCNFRQISDLSKVLEFFDIFYLTCTFFADFFLMTRKNVSCSSSSSFYLQINIIIV